MKKILAFITSLSMCFSLLTALSPASAYADAATGVSVEERISVGPEETEQETTEDVNDLS